MYILKYLTERGLQLLIVNYAWNRYAFTLRHNSRFGVLENRLNYFPDKNGIQVKVSCRDNARHAQPPVSNKSFISAGRTGLGSTDVTLGQPAAFPNCALGQTLPERPNPSYYLVDNSFSCVNSSMLTVVFSHCWPFYLSCGKGLNF